MCEHIHTPPPPISLSASPGPQFTTAVHSKNVQILKINFTFFCFLNILYIHTGSTPPPRVPRPEADGGEQLAATDANFKKISILNRCSAVMHPNPLVVSTRAPQYPILWSVCDHRRASRNQEDGKVQIYRQIQVINIFKSNLKNKHQCNQEWRSVCGAASFSRHRLMAACACLNAGKKKEKPQKTSSREVANVAGTDATFTC